MKSLFAIALLGAILVGNTPSLMGQNTQTSVQQVSPRFTLLSLSYATDALSPVISQQTIELHHGKHLQAYLNNVNKLIVGTKWEQADLVTIVRESEGTLFNNAGQVLNHNLYFLQFNPKPKLQAPRGKLAKLITDGWGSFEAFQKDFEQAGAKLFGSGWLWLSQDTDGKLQITLHAGGDNPVSKGWIPLLGVDLWEHAYYLDYQNRRADHLKALWTIIDWSVIATRLQK